MFTWNTPAPGHLQAMSDAGAVETSEWNPDDPNVLRLKLKGGRGAAA